MSRMNPELAAELLARINDAERNVVRNIVQEFDLIRKEFVVDKLSGATTVREEKDDINDRAVAGQKRVLRDISPNESLPMGEEKRKRVVEPTDCQRIKVVELTKLQAARGQEENDLISTSAQKQILSKRDSINPMSLVEAARIKQVEPTNLQAARENKENENGGTAVISPKGRGVLIETASNKPVLNLEIKKEVKEEISEYQVDTDGYVIVYTAGRCRGNGQSSASAGIGVWWSDNSKLNVSQALAGSGNTNNMAELKAARFAVSQARRFQIKQLSIHTGSEYVVNIMNGWINVWKKNGWRTTKNKPISNQALLQALDAEIGSGQVHVKWSHVLGNVYGNQQAGKLAADGMK